MAYKDDYANIGVMFAMTVVIKMLAKSGGAKDQSDLIAVGGGALTIGQFVKLIAKIKASSFVGEEGKQKLIGGVIGQGLDTQGKGVDSIVSFIMGLFK